MGKQGRIVRKPVNAYPGFKVNLFEDQKPKKNGQPCPAAHNYITNIRESLFP